MTRPSGYRELLANRRFVLYEASAVSASVGYSVYAISVPWLALQLTGNLLLVGVAVFVELAAYSLTFLVAPWVDRARNKRTIFVLCYPIQAALAATLGLGIMQGWLTPWALLVLIAAISFVWDFPWAAYNVVPRMLLSKDQLFRAEGFTGLLGGITQIGGFSAGGALVILVGPSGGMFLYTALLLAGAALAAVVSLPSDSLPSAAQYWSDFREGWTHFAPRAPDSLFQLGLTDIVRGFFSAAPTLVITAIAARTLSDSATAYSILFVASVVGGVAAGVLLGELNPRHRVGGLLLGTCIAEALLFLAAAFIASSLVLGAAVWLLIGGVGTGYFSAKYVFIQGGYPPERLGRITSNLYVFSGVSGAVGAVVLGLLASSWSIPALGAVVAAGFGLVAIMIVLLPNVRRAAF